MLQVTVLSQVLFELDSADELALNLMEAEAASLLTAPLPLILLWLARSY